MNAGRTGRSFFGNRSPHRPTTRWVLFGVVTAVLAVLLVLTLLLGNEGNDETDEDSVATCEEHGIAPPDPRAQPEPVGDTGGEVGETSASVQLGREFTSDYSTGEYHLFTRHVDFTEPVGVVVRLHGDGGDEYNDPDGLLNCLAAVAASHNMILLTPLSPDEQGEVTWWEDISENMLWVRELLNERVLEPYTVDTERVWWMGYSGGAEMITYGVLPQAPRAVTGGAVMIGGGGAPERLVEEPTSEQQETLDLIWVTGALDEGKDPAAPFNAAEAAREGSTWYRRRGFEHVRAEYPDGHDHFSLPQARILDDVLEEELQGQ